MLTTALKSELLRVWLVSTVIFVFFASGYVDTIDAVPSFNTAKAILERGELSIPLEDAVGYGVNHGRGKDGKWYTKMGLAYPALYIVPVGMAKVFSHYTGIREDVPLSFFVAMVNPLVAALLFSIIFFFIRVSGQSFQAALAVTVLSTFATLIFPYSKSSARELVQAFCLVGCFCFLGIAQARQKLIYYQLAGALVGFGILAKLALVVSFVPAGLFGLFICLSEKKYRAKRLWAFLWPIIGLMAIWFIFAYAVYENIFATGYSKQTMSIRGKAWNIPFWTGLYVQTLSSKTGLLFYCPALLLGFWVFLKKIGNRQVDSFDLAIISTIVIHIIFYAKWFSPSGGESLGPRYLVPITPLLFLMMRDPFKTYFPKGWMKKTAIGFAGFCVAMQFVHVCIKSQQFYTYQEHRKIECSHWEANLRFFAHKLTDGTEKYQGICHTPGVVVDLSGVETVQGFNFWWKHANRWFKARKKANPKPGAVG